jgi:hypothetical protein
MVILAVRGDNETLEMGIVFHPVAREFYKCSSEDFREAGIELVVMTFFSTMPLWIMAILGPIIFETQISFLQQLLSTIRGGELFV